MIHSIRVYRVPYANVVVFLEAFEDGGSWREFVRGLPGYVFTDVIQSHERPSIFLAMEFWFRKT